ncbi:PRC-barrel domain-containing protein [Paraliobacillus sediminis]|uniref:PRC-barrel domain-containing protein n=1 Tax=Paraliobacillus sediminis TaxID=1885916 RepID=UPI0023DDD8F6|nr:PRC-barrel domain-containing protein [Paraliobacillus sediminis]
MYYLATTLKKYNIQATDDQLGHVKDIYFDDKYWTVRYLVVDTSKWLPSKKVLLSPISLDKVDSENKAVNVLTSKETVKSAPHKKENEPISKQYEIDLAGYYEIPIYWSGTGPWSGFPTPAALGLADKQKMIQSKNATSQEDNNYLRSVNEVRGELTGYTVEGIGGKIGYVFDVIIDDSNWKINYLVVETSKFLAANYILVATDWINDVQWQDKNIYVEVDSVKAKNVTDYDIHAHITKEYEDKLYSALGKNRNSI